MSLSFESGLVTRTFTLRLRSTPLFEHLLRNDSFPPPFLQTGKNSSCYQKMTSFLRRNSPRTTARETFRLLARDTPGSIVTSSPQPIQPTLHNTSNLRPSSPLSPCPPSSCHEARAHKDLNPSICCLYCTPWFKLAVDFIAVDFGGRRSRQQPVRTLLNRVLRCDKRAHAQASLCTAGRHFSVISL